MYLTPIFKEQTLGIQHAKFNQIRNGSSENKQPSISTRATRSTAGSTCEVVAAQAHHDGAFGGRPQPELLF